MEKRKLFKLKQGEEVYFIIIDNKNFKVRKAKVDYVSSYGYIYVSYEKETYGFKIENKNSVSSIKRNSNLTYILGTDISTVMKEKKQITLCTVLATSVGAIFFIAVAFYHRHLLAKTTALSLMIVFAVSWSLNAIISIAQYLKQRNQVE